MQHACNNELLVIVFGLQVFLIQDQLFRKKKLIKTRNHLCVFDYHKNLPYRKTLINSFFLNFVNLRYLFEVSLERIFGEFLSLGHCPELRRLAGDRLHRSRCQTPEDADERRGSREE